MPGPYRRKKHHTGDTHFKQIYRTKNRRKDLDEIRDDLENKAEELLNQETDPDKPGEGQFYCIHCARYFIDDFSLTQHYRTKAHKKRLKDLEKQPYTIEDSQKAAGFGSFSN
ncbi:hypothetical protein V9T40_005731 [Parthenolecanium corni]|uniref:Zinc finger protein 593 homolog n=1 Tax=Parthenolecanium corni TaxID=536013 RepID=A0AAN9TT31_9HEMI